jgi:hypothetical protein
VKEEGWDSLPENEGRERRRGGRKGRILGKERWRNRNRMRGREREREEEIASK